MAPDSVTSGERAGDDEGFVDVTVAVALVLFRDDRAVAPGVVKSMNRLDSERRALVERRASSRL